MEIAELKNEIRILKLEKNKLEKQPYKEVKDKIVEINNLLIKTKQELNKKIYEDELKKANSYIKRKKPQMVECIVEKSAFIRYEADIQINILYDITNNINFTSFKTPEKILNQQGLNDYELATTYCKIICLKIGDKYFVNVKY